MVCVCVWGGGGGAAYRTPRHVQPCVHPLIAFTACLARVFHTGMVAVVVVAAAALVVVAMMLVVVVAVCVAVYVAVCVAVCVAVVVVRRRALGGCARPSPPASAAS